MPAIKWSYALNQWRATYDTFVRQEQHERALKTLAACGFHSIEISCGPGRWDPLGNREMIEANHGSISGLRQWLQSCGIETVSSFFLDPAMFLSAQGDVPLSAANPAHRREIAELARSYIEMLPQLGGDRLIVRAAPPFWRNPDPGTAFIDGLAQCWNDVAEAAAGSGVRIGLHLDCIAAIRSRQNIAALLHATDPNGVGLAIDTAEFVIAGLDPQAVFEEFPHRVVHFQLKDAVEVDELQEYRLAHAEQHMLSSGGQREVTRWFWEMGVPRGRVDFPALLASTQRHGYDGWMVVESDQSPYPATSAMLNAWYIKHRLQVPIRA
jgi:inosose dehydratase